MSRTIWTSILALVACNCESGPTPVVKPANVALVPAKSDLRPQMRAHHEAATALQRAISQGRLIDAREQAAWIGEYANPRSDELLTAAFQIAQARDLRAAAALTGDLAAACSTCHVETGARPVITIPPPPAAVPGIEAQMQLHQWAAARLWDGVIAPDDAAWQAGARTMMRATIDLGATTHAKPNSDVVGYAEALHGLAETATTTTGHTARAVLYGEMLETCANCHAIVRPRTIAEGK